MNEEITVLVHIKKGSFYDITDAITSLTWEGDYKSPSRTLNFSIVQPLGDKDVIKNIGLNEGSTVCFYVDKVEKFRGNVIDLSKNSSDNTVEIVAKDMGLSLGKDKISKNYHDKKAEDIAKEILSEKKYKIGSLAKAPTKVTKVYKGKSIYETIMDVYTRQAKQDKKKYMMVVDLDKVSVIEKGKTHLSIAFSEKENIIESTYSISIEDMVNRVEVIGKNGEKISEQVNKDIYNIYRHYITETIEQNEGKPPTKEEIESTFKGPEKTCSLNGIGNITCVSGTKVSVKDEYTGLVGIFYVDADEHSWQGGKYEISLTLNFENIMDEKEVGEDEQKEETDNTDGSSMTTVEGREVSALFTAYYPANTPMQGGFYDCKGKRLNPSAKTCAAPKSVPYGMKVRFSCPGTVIDNQTYTVNDRGGAINIVNGVYHFDILMSSLSECNRFGKRRGKAWILDGTKTRIDGGNMNISTQRQRLINEAKKHLGKRYVWGATGPGTFDCSGLTSYVYRHGAGINIPRVSRDQARSGRFIARQNLLPGDLLFWARGNYVHHVAMYIGNGQYIHAPQPGDHVRIAKLGSYYTARRILND